MKNMISVRRKARQLVMASILCLGFWQFGQGAYIPAKAWVAQELMQRAWARSAASQSPQTPWPWADTWPVARLSSSRAGSELIVLAGGSGRTLAFGPGHLSISALPGHPGNSVIAGHRDTHFRFLQHLQLDDLINVEVPGGQEFQYRVTHIDVVDARRGSLQLDTEASILSLVTCYPFSAMEAGGPLRYIVSAELDTQVTEQRVAARQH